jgi:hypothetical protein
MIREREAILISEVKMRDRRKNRAVEQCEKKGCPTINIYPQGHVVFDENDKQSRSSV